MSALPLEDVRFGTDAQSFARVLPFPRTGCPTSQRLAPTLSQDDRELLNRLRWLAMKSRLAPQPDLERACFLLAGQADVSLERYAVAFFKGLATRASREMTFYRPGSRTASDDELWLLRLMAAARDGENAAVKALVAWRVRRDGQRWLRFLASGLAQGLFGFERSCRKS